MPNAIYIQIMKYLVLILLLVTISHIAITQSLCDHKSPLLYYNKISKTYNIKDGIKPYKIVWYRNDTVIKSTISNRTEPIQIISVPNFRHYEVCPHILRNGDLYFIGDSFWHYTVFKVNFQNSNYERLINLSDFVLENKDFLDSIHFGQIGRQYGYSYSLDSCHEITNNFVMDNDGTMYINKLYIKNFISFNPISKTYKLIDSAANPSHQIENFSEHNFLNINVDNSVFRSKELPIPFNRFLRYNFNPNKLDSLVELANLITQGSWAIGLYKNKRYLIDQANKLHQLGPNFDKILETKSLPIIFRKYAPGLIDGQGTIYMTKLNSFSLFNEIHDDRIFLFNTYLNTFDSILMPKDSLNLSLVKASVRIDCSGSLYAFGYLYKDDNDHRTAGRHTLNLYKQTAYIDTGLDHSFDTTLRAIVYYYDADSVILESKRPINRIDTNTCNTYKYKNITYTQSGSLSDTFYSSNGIDTILFINYTIHKTIYDTLKQTSCDSFIYKNTTYKNSGTYTFPYKTTMGCDSVHTLQLTIHKSFYRSETFSSCTAHRWLDSTYTQSGIYTRRYKTIHQCDSTLVQDLRIGLDKRVKLDNGIHYTALKDSVAYQWYRCHPWRRITNETERTFTTKTRGSYAVVLDNRQGCRDTSDCIELYSSQISLPIASESGQPSWTVYPNPFKEVFHINLDRPYKKIHVRLYDLMGRLILTEYTQHTSEFKIKNSELPKGSYYLQIETEAENRFFNILKE